VKSYVKPVKSSGNGSKSNIGGVGNLMGVFPHAGGGNYNMSNETRSLNNGEGEDSEGVINTSYQSHRNNSQHRVIHQYNG
jgi:hypothetical protein